MKQSVLWALIKKDLYLLRFVILIALVLGIAFLAIMPLGSIAFFVGATFFLAVIIIMNVVIVLAAVTQENKDKIYLFIMSLPISYHQYIKAKVISNTIAFFSPLLILFAACLAFIKFTTIPDSIIPLSVALVTNTILYYGVYLMVSLFTSNGAISGVIVVLGNISYSFLIPYIFNLPSAAERTDPNQVIWDPEIFWIIAVHLVLTVVAILSAYFFQSRKRDLI